MADTPERIDAAKRIELIHEGKRYSGWKSARVTRTIEGLCGSFALEVSPQPINSDMLPIFEGDACRIEINGKPVIDGFIDKRSPGGSATSRKLSFEGRDRTQDLVDCSVLVPDTSTKGHKWTYRNIDIAQFVAAVAKPHGIAVRVQEGLVLKKDPLLVAHPGETGFEAIRRAVGSSGVLVVSDGAGGIIITRTGNTRATTLREGENILSGECSYDATGRFARYLISSQPPGTDEASGEATRVQAEAKDLDVDRQNRVLLIRPEKGYNAEGAKRRADWEARIRAAKAADPTVTVHGWEQPDGDLWPINALVNVIAPRLIGIDGDMLISQVEYSIGDGGEICQLKLARPDAFTPEPQNVPAVSGEGLWKFLTPDGAH